MQKLTRFIAALAVLAMLAAPAFSSPSATKKIDSLYKELKALPNQSSTSKAKDLALQLAKLDPKKAYTYLDLALTKFEPGADSVTAARETANEVEATVKSAGLPAGQINSINKNIERLAQLYISNPPPATHANDAPKKTTITFGAGTTVKVNGQAVESGYQLRKGDQVTVSGGPATLNQVIHGKVMTENLAAGTSLTETTTSYGQEGVRLQNGVFLWVDASSIATPPPPSPEKNNSIVKIVSPSAP